MFGREGLAIFRDGFVRDIAILLVVTIFIGSGLAAGVAWVADTYFGDTVSGLIGDIGQYDFIVQVRQEARAAAKAEMGKTLRTLPGAKVKEGIGVAGRANFFISMPPALKNRQVFENLGDYFSDLPGYSGYTLIIEPSITLRGIQGGSANFLLPQLEKISGVAFAFVHGESITLVLNNKQDTLVVDQKVKQVLARYRLVQVQLPLGFPDDQKPRVGQRMVSAISSRLNPGMVLDVTRAGADDSSALAASLAEMQSFLKEFATQVTVKLTDTASLRPGDQVVLRGSSLTPPVVGDTVQDGNLVAKIDRIEGSMAYGFVTKGDAAPYLKTVKSEAGGLPATPGAAYKIDSNNEVVSLVGEAALESKRESLITNIDRGVKAMDQAESLTQEAKGKTAQAKKLLGAYSQTETDLQKAQGILQDAQAQMGTGSGVDPFTFNQMVSSLNQLNNSINGLKKEINAFKGSDSPKMAEDTDSTAALMSSSGLMTSAEALAQLQPRIALFLIQSEGASLLSGKPSLPAGELKTLTGNVRTVAEAMGQVDAKSLEEQVAKASEKLDAMNLPKTDLKKQAATIQDTLPSLNDESIGRSLGLINEYLDGQNVPGETKFLLVDAATAKKDLAGVIRSELKADQVSVVDIPAGAIEPDARGTLVQILRQVRSTIAGMLAVIFVLLVLILDHGTVVSSIREVGRRRSRNQRRLPLPDAGSWYGALAGMVMFSGIYLLSGATLPLFKWYMVPLTGLVLGWFISTLAGRISPVDSEEFLAGESLGLTYAQVMREIVIPSGRPGILSWLNRRRQRF